MARHRKLPAKKKPGAHGILAPRRSKATRGRASIATSAAEPTLPRNNAMQRAPEAQCPVSRRILGGDAEMLAFFKLLATGHVPTFLAYDVHRHLSDKYLLAMVFIYFKRAMLELVEYTPMNFFVGLYLANDVEEDNEDHKYNIIKWALTGQQKVNTTSFMKLRDELWRKMDHKAIVRCEECEEIMSIKPRHPAWSRARLLQPSCQYQESTVSGVPVSSNECNDTCAPVKTVSNRKISRKRTSGAAGDASAGKTRVRDGIHRKASTSWNSSEMSNEEPHRRSVASSSKPACDFGSMGQSHNRVTSKRRSVAVPPVLTDRGHHESLGSTSVLGPSGSECDEE